MQKIGFNERYGMQRAVFDGTKNMIRIIEKALENAIKYYRNSYSDKPNFYIISQRYSERGGIEVQLERDFIFIPTRYKLNEIVAVAQSCKTADIMTHHIKIKNIKIEKLRYISDEDCIREGIVKNDTFTKYGIPNDYSSQCNNDIKKKEMWFNSPKDAFATLIEKMGGKGLWELNPWVIVYEFDLIN